MRRRRSSKNGPGFHPWKCYKGGDALNRETAPAGVVVARLSPKAPQQSRQPSYRNPERRHCRRCQSSCRSPARGASTRQLRTTAEKLRQPPPPTKRLAEEPASLCRVCPPAARRSHCRLSAPTEAPAVEATEAASHRQLRAPPPRALPHRRRPMPWATDSGCKSMSPAPPCRRHRLQPDRRQ